jgi:hypothetical protein
MSQNGKGDKDRVKNYKQYIQNYEEIEFRNKGTYCEECGKTLQYDEGRKFHTDGHVRCINCNYN